MSSYIETIVVGDDPHGFMLRGEIMDYVECYAASSGPPLRGGVEVRRISACHGSARFKLEIRPAGLNGIDPNPPLSQRFPRV